MAASRVCSAMFRSGAKRPTSFCRSPEWLLHKMAATLGGHGIWPTTIIQSPPAPWKEPTTRSRPCNARPTAFATRIATTQTVPQVLGRRILDASLLGQTRQMRFLTVAVLFADDRFHGGVGFQRGRVHRNRLAFEQLLLSRDRQDEHEDLLVNGCRWQCWACKSLGHSFTVQICSRSLRRGTHLFAWPRSSP